MLAALLALIPGGVPSIATLKLITLGVAFLAWTGLAVYGGYRWELSAYETAIAKSAEHQLKLEQQYQAIGDELGKTYTNAQTASQARARLELQALRKGASAAACPDVAGVLRRAYAPNATGVPGTSAIVHGRAGRPAPGR